MLAFNLTSAEPTQIGNYDLLGKVGKGGAGTVYRAVDRTSGQVVAVKVMPADLARNPVQRKRFEEEFRTARQLDHPNIVRALDYQDAEKTPYLVMEFVEGESLGDRLEQHGRMEETEALAIIRQVCLALTAAHAQGIIHRDIKPDNILVRPDGQIKLTDLGLVKRLETEHNLTQAGRGLGTPHFMAPEQFRNAKGADVLCDVYSVGATLYMMVTGELPFQAKNPFDTWTKKMKGELTPPREFAPDLSPHIEAVIARAMNSDPVLRPASCQAFADALGGVALPRTSVVRRIQAEMDLWHVLYQQGGVLHTITGNTRALRQTLVKGQLGDLQEVRGSRCKSGPFERLVAYPEFQDLLAPELRETAVAEPPRRTRTRESHVVLPPATASSTVELLKNVLLVLLAAVAAAALGRMVFGF